MVKDIDKNSTVIIANSEKIIGSLPRSGVRWMPTLITPMQNFTGRFK